MSSANANAFMEALGATPDFVPEEGTYTFKITKARSILKNDEQHGFGFDLEVQAPDPNAGKHVDVAIWTANKFTGKVLYKILASDVEVVFPAMQAAPDAKTKGEIVAKALVGRIIQAKISHNLYQGNVKAQIAYDEVSLVSGVPVAGVAAPAAPAAAAAAPAAAAPVPAAAAPPAPVPAAAAPPVPQPAAAAAAATAVEEF